MRFPTYRLLYRRLVHPLIPVSLEMVSTPLSSSTQSVPDAMLSANAALGIMQTQINATIKKLRNFLNLIKILPVILNLFVIILYTVFFIMSIYYEIFKLCLLFLFQAVN